MTRYRDSEKLRCDVVRILGAHSLGCLRLADNKILLRRKFLLLLAQHVVRKSGVIFVDSSPLLVSLALFFEADVLKLRSNSRNIDIDLAIHSARTSRLGGARTQGISLKSEASLLSLAPLCELNLVHGETAVVSTDILDFDLEVLSRLLSTGNYHNTKLLLVFIAYDLKVDFILSGQDLLKQICIVGGKEVESWGTVWDG